LGMAKKHRSRILLASTSEIYGDPLVHPQPEHYWGNVNPVGPRSCYDEGKRAAETLFMDYHRQEKVRIKIVRIFNTYGPRQSARAVIPTIISQALTRDELHIGSLDTRRDFTYVDDTVSGFIKAAEAGDEVLGDVYNLGTGVDVTIQEIIEAVFKITGKELPIIQEAARMRPEKSEVMRLLSDYSKAQAALGWEPTVDLAEGLRRTVEWIGENIDIYRPDVYQR